MSSVELPDRASLEYLKKLAKERLRALREIDPQARLSDAQRAVARDHGFSSWRGLKAAVERPSPLPVEAFHEACASADLPVLRSLLERAPDLVFERLHGTTPLHVAVRHPDVVRLLLGHGADPNIRDEGDHALPLHFAAGHGDVDSVRALLDAGSDVQGLGDAHRLDVIGWAACFEEPRRDVVDLLVSRGARHHVFSAVAMGDPEVLRAVVREDPRALERRLAPEAQEQTALHYVIAPPDGLVGGLFRTGAHYRTLEELMALGADLEARDGAGRTPLEVALLRGDQEATRRLHGAGAKRPTVPPAREMDPALASSVGGMTPMLTVSDMKATVAWYQRIGFELIASHGERGELDWARMKFGAAELMFSPSADARRHPTSGLSLWIETTRLDELYTTLKRLQLSHAGAALEAGTADTPLVQFTFDLYTAFYGQREFGIRDPNGVELMFAQRIE